MDAVTTAPAHELLQRKDKADSHSTRAAKNATASLLSDYSFGPADTGESGKSADSNSVKPTHATISSHMPLVAHSASTLSVLQSVDSSLTGSEKSGA